MVINFYSADTKIEEIKVKEVPVSESASPKSKTVAKPEETKPDNGVHKEEEKSSEAAEADNGEEQKSEKGILQFFRNLQTFMQLASACLMHVCNLLLLIYNIILITFLIVNLNLSNQLLLHKCKLENVLLLHNVPW